MGPRPLCRVVACGPTGVPGAAWPVSWAGLLGAPVGGGPPASRPRRELRSARRLEARPGPAAAHGHRSQASQPPTGTAADPSGALHTSGAWSLFGSSTRRLKARPGPAAVRAACCCLWPHGCSGRRRARPPARLGGLTSFGATPRSPPVPSGPSGALRTSGSWCADRFGASSRSPARPCRRSVIWHVIPL